jgi:hypothetical protein
MSPEMQIHTLLDQYKLRFNWSAEMKSWWLEGTAYNGQLWQSQFFHANSEQDAMVSAIQYLNGFRNLE